MSETRPSTEQLRFTSSKTGEQLLDTYLEAAERGNRSLPDLMADLFDSSGVTRQNLEWRINGGFLEFRYNFAVNPTAQWVQAGPFLRDRGAHVPGTTYAPLEIVSSGGALYFAAAQTNTTPPAAPWLTLSTTGVLGAQGGVLQTPAVRPTINGQNSLLITDDAVNGRVNITLQNDSASPGTGRYYGTDAGGVRGWHALPSFVSPAFTGTPTAPTAAQDTNTTQLATTAYVLGQAGSANPLMSGVAAPGTSLRFARQDHVHPVDTSRAPLASPAFTGTPTAPTAAQDTNTTQLATTSFVISQAATVLPLVNNGAGAVGTSLRFARQDHSHPRDQLLPSTKVYATSGAWGSTNYSPGASDETFFDIILPTGTRSVAGTASFRAQASGGYATAIYSVAVLNASLVSQGVIGTAALTVHPTNVEFANGTISFAWNGAATGANWRLRFYVRNQDAPTNLHLVQSYGAAGIVITE